MPQSASTSFLPSLPPVPAFDQLHPLVIHFPIALALVAPIFIALAIALPRQARPMLAAASLLLVLASIAAAVATLSGEAAKPIAETFLEAAPGSAAVLDAHEILGNRARNALIGLTLLQLMLTALAFRGGSTPSRKLLCLGGGTLLAANGAAALLVASAAHEGGRLVHEFGVRAWAVVPSTPSSSRAGGQGLGHTGSAAPAATIPQTGTLSATSKPLGFVKSMKQVDVMLEKLVAHQREGWTTNDGRCQTEAVNAETIVELLAALPATERVKAKPLEFTEWLLDNGKLAESLRQGLKNRHATGKPEAAELNARLELLSASCEHCHAKYRE